MRKGGLLLRLSTVSLVAFGLVGLPNPASGSDALPTSGTSISASTYEALVKSDLGQAPSLAANGSSLLPTAAQLTPPPPPPPPPVVTPPAAAAPAHVVSITRLASTAPAPPAQPAGYGCAAALAYLSAHSAPGFRFECPGYALGHQAMTCLNVPGVCPGYGLITIAVPCAAAYMNEAHNSWVVLGDIAGPIDPYGYCH
ncbi:MAG TPA: hypothetical protein VFV02_12995 [Acidimicrobiales bacterium]|nr:hypothetical protein [Acidimicrobiales bacterium]